MGCSGSLVHSDNRFIHITTYIEGQPILHHSSLSSILLDERLLGDQKTVLAYCQRSSLSNIMAAPTASDKPAMKPPRGQTSNFVDPPSQSYVIIVSSVFFLVITTPFLILRIYTRKFINRRLWWDDCKLFSCNRVFFSF